MKNFYIEKITVSGPNRQDSIVEFTPGLTIISGPSNTGKTCIVKCINFIFGDDREPFSNDTGYNSIRVLVKTSFGSVIFERLLGKRKIKVTSYDERIESGEYNSKAGKRTISTVWLKIIGIEEDIKIISNEDYRRRNLTWRTFSHFFMIDEHEIDREESILLPKQNTAKTAFYSSLIYLIYGEDFSKHDEKKSKEERKIIKGAVEKYINTNLSSIANRKETILEELEVFQDVDIQEEINRLVEVLSETENKISGAMNRNKELLDDLFKKEERLAECSLLSSRYRALETQYTSDIKRLSFIVEGEIVGSDFSYRSNCPFCESELQKKYEESYIETARAEVERIIAQLSGLEESSNEVQRQIVELEDEIKNLQKEKQELDDLIKLNLEPKANRLKESIKNNQKYIELKNELEVIKRLSDSWVTDLRDIEQEEDTETKYKPLEHFDKGFWDKMDSLLLEILEACKYTPLVSARFGKSSFDIEVNGSKKADNHGKGYRAFLNTIVVLAFRKYMSMEAIYKPSLLVVDTPLLGFDEGTNSETPESQQKALFKYFMNYQHEGQTIVIENSNTIPSLDYEAAGVNEIKFTRGQQEGRYGFLHGVSNGKK